MLTLETIYIDLIQDDVSAVWPFRSSNSASITTIIRCIHLIADCPFHFTFLSFSYHYGLFKGARAFHNLFKI